MSIKPINSLAEFKALIAGDKPVIIDFWATWCGPCKMVSPTFEKLAGVPENQGIGFYKVDVDHQMEIAKEVGIKAMPTFLVFKSGIKVGEFVGANPSALTNLVATHSTK